MAYPLRQYVPGQLFELTCRAFQGRPLLAGREDINATFIGVLARACQLYGVAVHAVVTLTNHYHLLATPQDANAMAQFMRFLNQNVSRKVGPLVGWSDGFWSRRVSAILVSEEPAAQAARLRYLLAHGVKEGLVQRVADWNGVHSATALMTGRPLLGRWRDQDRATRFARRRGPDAVPADVDQVMELRLAPLPAFADLTPEAYQELVAGLVADIEQAGAHGAATATPAASAPAPVTEPAAAPARPLRDKRPAPRFHAATATVACRLSEQYEAFVEAYRAAAEAERAGVRNVVFPPHCFPPGRRARSNGADGELPATLLW